MADTYPEGFEPLVGWEALRHVGTIQQLLGCVWGRGVTTPDDEKPCDEQAVKIVVLHDGPVEHALKLCSKHLARVEQETTPRS